MKTVFKTLLATAAMALATQAHAATVFSDNFNTENGGVGVYNYYGFANWTVSPGSVALIGTNFFDLFPGHGMYSVANGPSVPDGGQTYILLGMGIMVLAWTRRR